MGLRLGLMRGNRGGGAAADFTVSLTNLTSGEARQGATIGVNIPELVGGETITYQWTDGGSNISGATSSTFTVNIGTNMTDGQTLRCVATIDGTPYTSNGASARYAPGTASSIADGQTFNTSTAVNLDASASGTGLTWSYAATGLPSGLSINSGTGAITGTPSGATSGTVTVTATDQYGRTVQDTFTYTVVVAVNPAISSDSFTASGSGSPAVWTVEGSYAGADTLVLEGVTGTDPITVSAAQLTAGSGGSNTLEFFTIDPFTFSSNNDLTGLTSTSESATRIAYQVREKNNGGTTGVQTPADVISGLDYTVPAWGSGITAASSVDGNSIVLTSSEALFGTQDNADFTVAGAASTPTVTAVSGFGTTSITLTLSAAIAGGETITLDFADTDTNLRDAAGNLIGDIGTPISVTNNVPSGTTYTFPLGTPAADIDTLTNVTLLSSTAGGFIEVTSGQLRSGTASNFGVGRYEWTPGAVGNDQVISARYKDIGGNGAKVLSLYLRTAPDSNNLSGYGVRISNDSIQLRRRSGGSEVTLGSSYSWTPTLDDVISLEANETSLTVNLNGSAIIGPETDATFSSGGAGFVSYIENAGGYIGVDQVEWGDL